MKPFNWAITANKKTVFFIFTITIFFSVEETTTILSESPVTLASLAVDCVVYHLASSSGRIPYLKNYFALCSASSKNVNSNYHQFTFSPDNKISIVQIAEFHLQLNLVVVSMGFFSTGTDHLRSFLNKKKVSPH